MLDDGNNTYCLLLVDDKESNILMLNEALSDDYRILFAMDGLSALEIAGEKLPDLILLDIQMPQMDGLEVCRRLKADSRTTRIPVIFVTALTEQVEETAGLALGAVDYISKPYDPNIVRLRVKNQLIIKSYQDHLEDLVKVRTAKLEKTMAIVEASDRAKTKILMILAHELRTPLNHIIGFSELLKEMVKDEEPLDFAKIIFSAATRLGAIVENVLDLVKLESGMMTITCRAFNFYEFLKPTVDAIIKLYENKNIVFSLEFDKDIPESVNGDVKRIMQVLHHLLDNAFKFTSKGSVRLRVSRGGDDGIMDQLIFSIRDSGPGIPVEKQTEIFGLFSGVVENVSTQHKGGVGIGLALCQHMARLMNGRVWLNESGPEGSEFLFSIRCQGHV